MKNNQHKYQTKYTIYKDNNILGSVEVLRLNAVILYDTEGSIIEFPEFKGYSEAIYVEKQYFDSPESARSVSAKNQYCIVKISNYMGTEGSLSKEEIYKILENLEIIVP